MDNGNQDNLISKQICHFQLVDIKKENIKEKKSSSLLIVATKKSLMHLILLIGYVVP